MRNSESSAGSNVWSDMGEQDEICGFDGNCRVELSLCSAVMGRWTWEIKALARLMS